MKRKINKACDLNSISVFPPQSRGSSVVSSRLESSSVFGGSQPASQLRPQQPQPSQLSLSQGISSQHGLLSQFSQNSQSEALTNEKIGSQEKENAIRRTACLPPMSHTQEESRMMVSRTSNNAMRKWSSQEYKSKNSEELEHRIGMVETSLSRLGMILDSVQNDIMQVNKGTKEVALEMEGVRQRLIIHEDSVQSMSRGQEGIKTQLDMGLKSLSNQLRAIMNQEMLEKIVSNLSSFSEKIDSQLLKLQKELQNKFCKEIQVISSNIKMSQQRQTTSPVHWPKAVSFHTPKQVQCLNSSTLLSKAKQGRITPKVEMGGWTSVKQEQITSKYGTLSKRSNQIRAPPTQLECQVVIDLDDECFSCLDKEKGTEIDEDYSTKEAIEESARILRKARRRKRRNTIIIN